MMNMKDEQALLEAVRRRDPEAFAVLFDAYADKVYRVAVGVLDDEDEAEGVVQDTFLTLFEKIDHFEGRSSLGTWLYRIAYNGSLDRVRKRRPEQALADEPDDDEGPFEPLVLADWSDAPEELLTSAEAQAELERAIGLLPQRLRGTFILREIEGLSTAETAEVLGIKPGTVKVQLHRARLLLREHLSGYFSERLPATQE
jgi:RNA polymerase sigma-70 factor (ECF subfamily)